jgi:hypothetical protein
VDSIKHNNFAPESGGKKSYEKKIPPNSAAESAANSVTYSAEISAELFL